MGCAFIFAYMKAAKSTTELMSAARELEEASRLTEAAGLYQQLVDTDPTNQQAVSRLLTLYRRLKEPKKELAVIQDALAAYAQKDKATQERWVNAHPQAAKASRAFLRSLGGSSASSFGANAQVQRLQKRREIVEKKLHGRTEPKAAARKSKAAARKAEAAVTRKVAAAAAKEKRAGERRLAAEQKKQAAEQRKHEAQKKKAEIAAARQAEAAARKQAAGAAKKAAAIPSLFVISIRYLAPLEAIDAMLPKHVAFLDKHFAAGDFLVAGRQIPRTGGIIIARGKDRASIERIMKQDPFLKNKLASIDIVQFAASKMNKKPW